MPSCVPRPVRQFFENGTIRPFVAMAFIGQMQERTADGIELRHLAFDFTDMFERNVLDVSACPFAIFIEREKVPDVFYRKSETARG